MKTLDEIKFQENKRHQAGMTVPEGFFEQFQQQLEAKIDTLEAVRQAPVVEMPVRRNSWLTGWSAAACVVLLIGLGFGVYQWIGEGSLATDTDPQMAKTESVESEEAEMEEMMIRSVNDFELYDFYCEL